MNNLQNQNHMLQGKLVETLAKIQTAEVYIQEKNKRIDEFNQRIEELMRRNDSLTTDLLDMYDNLVTNLLWASLKEANTRTRKIEEEINNKISEKRE
jgi:hypothetical protein